MATPTVKTTDQAVQTTLSLLQDLLSASAQTNFTVRLWDGTVWKPASSSASNEAQPGRGQKSFTLVLQHPGALRRMFLPPSELNLGEAYIYNDFDIEGDIEAVFPLADQFINIWRLYMSASAYAFQVGRNNIYQALLAKPDHGDSRLPLTRADWYATGTS